jgi:hypothetical protein
MILILQSLDYNIAIEDYKNAKMTDIITKINELLLQLVTIGKTGIMRNV